MVPEGLGQRGEVGAGGQGTPGVLQRRHRGCWSWGWVFGGPQRVPRAQAPALTRKLCSSLGHPPTLGGWDWRLRGVTAPEDFMGPGSQQAHSRPGQGVVGASGEGAVGRTCRRWEEGGSWGHQDPSLLASPGSMWAGAGVAEPGAWRPSCCQVALLLASRFPGPHFLDL